MRCPNCGKKSVDTRSVRETRTDENGFTVRRRRECIFCKHRWTTFERAGELSFLERRRKLSNHQIRAIYDSKDTFCSHELASLFGIHISTVRDIKRPSDTYKKIINATNPITFFENYGS
tara:strand:- start:295 stop:651 length:357 start_codon:yes stop_codon:yes gene_type:complete